MDIQRKNAMKDLEEQLNTADSQANLFQAREDSRHNPHITAFYLYNFHFAYIDFILLFQEKNQAASSTLDQLKIAVDSLFTKIKCDKADIVGQLGNTSISDANIMQYLGIIEHRTNELLQLQTLLDIQATQKWEKLEAELRDKADEGEQIDVAATLVRHKSSFI